MNCGNRIVRFDPYVILPSYGENRVEVNYKDGDVILVIYYDSTETVVEKKIEIIFKSVFFLKFSSFSNFKESLLSYQKDDIDSSKLIEFGYSDFKDSWENNFRNLFKLKHMQISFLQQNKVFEVICSSFNILN